LACKPLRHLLEDNTVVDFVNGLTQEVSGRMSQDEPVLLEYAEVGAVAGLSVT
jgi:hypothetical protein